jgi:uncharacterized protein YndB with AHSA1/START domain
MLNKQAPSAVHTTFSIERVYDAPPARVFAAWADPRVKARWFIGPETWTAVEREVDFRVGGREVLEGRFANGARTRFDGVYQDIAPERRVVFSYAMAMDGRRISVSRATVEIEPEGARTRLRFTEQAAFLDGFEDGGGRERGTRAHLDRIAAVLGAG